MCMCDWQRSLETRECWTSVGLGHRHCLPNQQTGPVPLCSTSKYKYTLHRQQLLLHLNTFSFNIFSTMIGQLLCNYSITYRNV